VTLFCAPPRDLVAAKLSSSSDFLLVDTPVNHAPTAATVVMQVDGSERRWNVRLPNGISAQNKRVQIAAAA
jgi:hypothetical protein